MKVSELIADLQVIMERTGHDADITLDCSCCTGSIGAKYAVPESPYPGVHYVRIT